MAEAMADGSNKVDPHNGSQGGELSDDLVRQVSDLVYAMLLRDLKLERERLGYSGGSMAQSTGLFRGGGW